MMWRRISEVPSADAQVKPAVLGNAVITNGDAGLNGDSAGDGVDHARELDQRPIAHELDRTAVVLGDRGVD